MGAEFSADVPIKDSKIEMAGAIKKILHYLTRDGNSVKLGPIKTFPVKEARLWP